MELAWTLTLRRSDDSIIKLALYSWHSRGRG